MKLSEVKKMSLSQIHNEITKSETRIKLLEDDRQKYRAFIKSEIQKQLQVQTESKYYTPKTILERHVAFVASVEPYHIWW